MERKVTVLSYKGTNTVVINSTATTLAELKAEMSAHNINFEGMSIFEGISKTELMDDTTILPSNLPYKGVVTNDLVILLSVKDKKITSGASAREAVYATIRANNLQADVQKKFGRNFTQVSTLDLVEFTTKVLAKKETASKKEEVKNTPKEATSVISPKLDLNPLEAVLVGFGILVGHLYVNGLVGEDCINDINVAYGGRFAILESEETLKEEEKSPYSSEELNEMFNFVK